MRLRENCAQLLDALGRRFGIEGLAFDERGLCSLAFDRSLTVNLTVDPRLNGLVLFAVLGEFAPLARPELLLAMLRGNFLWRVTEGATLAIDPERDAALLVQTYTPPAVASTDAAAEFEGRLNGFVNTALSWAGRLSRTDDPLPPMASMPPGMMLRV